MIGWGWRAEFYHRIARAIPEQFEITSVLQRSEQKAQALTKATGLVAVTTLDDLLKDGPDFVVVSVKRGATAGILHELFARGVPVLAETPPAESIEEMMRLWSAAVRSGARIRVAEQYPSQPLYSAWESFMGSGALGRVDNMSISALHGYHAMSIIRRYLGVPGDRCVIVGERFTFKVTETVGRDGPITSGAVVDSPRERATLAFESGKVAFFDFSDPTQYHSYIRTRQLNVQGTRGEIDDLTVRYLGPGGVPATQNLLRIDQGVFNNEGWSHQRLMLGDRVLYQSPFPDTRLNDDEIAVATCLAQMVQYLDSGVGGYPLEEALQDAYLSLMLEQAFREQYSPVETQSMPWLEHALS